MKLNLILLSMLLPAVAYGEQLSIARVDQMPDLPRPFKIIDYRELALEFDAKVYDFEAGNDYWPLIWIDENRENFDEPALGMFTTIGDVRQGPGRVKGSFHESLATMGGVLGASLVGINKRTQEHDYVSMLRNYFNRSTGWNIMMNNTGPVPGAMGGGYGRDWWYDVFPNVLFYGIFDQYPDVPGFEEMAKTIADKFYEADKILNGNYNYSYFDYSLMVPMTNWICAQPDAAAGHSWVLYSAWKKFGDPRYLDGARSSLRALESNKINPSYEVLIPFGALMAAKLNALHGENFDVGKILDWTFDGTAVCREGWGVLVGNWNGFDISGTVGSTVDHGGYGFLMNTFDMAWPLLPMVRYDQRFATAIGKWMLNAANASRLFYPEHIPDEHQTLPQLKELTRGVIAYEGIVKTSTHEQYSHLPGPVAQGDGPKWVANNPDVTQFSVYGSAHVGFFGGVIEKTNVEGILGLDLVKTDFFGEKAWPTKLYYNPHAEAKEVTLKLGHEVSLYDMVEGKFIAKGVSTQSSISIPAKSSRVIVTVPAKGKVRKSGNHLLVDGIVIDYRTKR